MNIGLVLSNGAEALLSLVEDGLLAQRFVRVPLFLGRGRSDLGGSTLPVRLSGEKERRNGHCGTVQLSLQNQ